jgi:hypothetical protein
MASTVEICNRALQKLGASRITSLTQDNKNARACNVAYEPVKLAVLRDHTWNCSIQRAEIAADATEPEWGRANSFTLPSDFVRLVDDYPEDNTLQKDWQIEGRKILTDYDDPIYIRYVYNVTDPNEMDSLLREAISAALAVELCEELTQSNTKKAALKEDYELILRRAKRTNAIENVAQDAPESSWLSSRS